MTPSRRLIVAVVVSLALSAPTAALVCVPLGLSTPWFAVASMAAGPFWASVAAWIIDKTEAARKRLQGAPRAPQKADAADLLALFAAHDRPALLGNLVLALNPEPALSWLHPCQRWNAMITWARRTTELVATARRLAEDGLLLRTERGRRWDATSRYEATELGRDVAARNAEVLMNGWTKEEA